jgi:hypothetical protein
MCSIATLHGTLGAVLSIGYLVLIVTFGCFSVVLCRFFMMVCGLFV